MSSPIIRQPFNDNRIFEYFELSNGLRVIGINSKDSNKSGCSLTINCGHFSNPKNLEGMSHFLEHMVFLGTKSFPNSNFFETFITENGGYENALTSNEYTTFYYEIQHESFEESLERFCSIFKNPLFLEKGVEKEIKVINEEFEKDRACDYRRFEHIIKKFSNPKSPFCQFQVGNKNTLNIEKIHEKVQKFFKENYSSNLMNLVVLGNMEIDKLKKLIKKFFGDIENKKIEKKIWKINPFENSKLLKRIMKIIPIETVYELNLIFPIEYMYKDYKTHQIDYVRYIIDTEETGSLFDYLKCKNWISAMSTSLFLKSNSWLLFNVEISMTLEGEKHVNDIIYLFFQYIEMIKKTPQEVKRRLFEELKTMSEIAFNFVEKKDTDKTVKSISQAMFKFNNIEDVLCGSILYFDFDYKNLSDLINSLNINNCSISWISSNFNGKENKNEFENEKWYGGKYLLCDLDEKLIEKCNNNIEQNSKLKFPRENPFIPKSLSFLKKEDVRVDISNVKENKSDKVDDNYYPKMFLNNEKYLIYVKEKNEYNQPQSYHSLKFFFPEASRTCKDATLFKFYVQQLHENLRETTFLAEMAYFNVLKYSNQYDLFFNIKGFNPTIEKVILRNMKEIFTPKILDIDSFKKIKEVLLRVWRNSLIDVPKEQCTFDAMFMIDYCQRYHIVDYIKSAEKLEYSDFIKFNERILNSCKIDYLCVGSKQKKIENIVKSIHKYVDKMDNVKRGDIISKRMVKLNEGYRYIYHKVNTNEKDENYCTLMYIQIGFVNDKLDMLTKLFSFLMEPYFYKRIRTEQNVGYDIGSYTVVRSNVLYIKFFVQSSKYDNYQILERLDNILIDYLSKIQTITVEEFKKELEMLRNEYENLENFENIATESSYYFYEIERKQFNFDRYKRLKGKALTELDLNQYKQFYKRYFVDNRTSIVCMMFPKNTEKDKMIEKKDDKTVYIKSEDIYTFSDTLGTFKCY